MPRKKKTPVKKRATRTRKKETRVVKPEKTFRWGESYTSLLLGIVVVIIGVLFVASLLKTHHTQDISATSTVNIEPTKQEQQIKPQQQTYVVQSGDDLWHIAEKYYQDGYKWTEIAKANNITNPSYIYKNDTLIIPTLPTSALSKTMTDNQIVTPTPDQNANPQAITTNTYTVQKGDDLWHIAIRAYADGYKWVDIAQANNLANPSYIYSGNVLTIPR